MKRRMYTPDRETLRQAGPALSLGYVITAAMVVLPLAGGWMGARWGHRDGGVLAGLALGLLYSAYEVWKVVRRVDAGDRRERRDPPAP